MDLGGVGQDIGPVEVLEEELNGQEFFGSSFCGVDLRPTASACGDGLAAGVPVEEAISKGEDVA